MGGGGGWIEKKERQKREIKIDGFGKDREGGVFCSSSFNLLHDSNCSICNELYDELILFSRVFPTLTIV